MFDNLNFKTVTTTGRNVSNDPVSITHSVTEKKNEVLFRLSRETMDSCGMKYGDKVHVQFANNNTVCRIIKSDSVGSVTLSQQVKDSESSAGIIRLTYKPTLPNFIETESKQNGSPVTKVRYVHENGMIEYSKEQNAVTFQLKLESKK
ncbi:hypothetical protein DXJ58_22280 [Vibrio fluvialis]|nr:hypothetical protein [Vibrio fluvialis]